MMRTRNMMTAITRRIWMNPPRIWNPINPMSQRTRRMIAIVTSIFCESKYL